MAKVLLGFMGAGYTVDILTSAKGFDDLFCNILIVHLQKSPYIKFCKVFESDFIRPTTIILSCF